MLWQGASHFVTHFRTASARWVCWCEKVAQRYSLRPHRKPVTAFEEISPDPQLRIRRDRNGIVRKMGTEGDEERSALMTPDPTSGEQIPASQARRAWCLGYEMLFSSGEPPHILPIASRASRGNELVDFLGASWANASGSSPPSPRPGFGTYTIILSNHEPRFYRGQRMTRQPSLPWNSCMRVNKASVSSKPFRFVSNSAAGVVLFSEYGKTSHLVLAESDAGEPSAYRGPALPCSPR